MDLPRGAQAGHPCPDLGGGEALGTASAEPAMARRLRRVNAVVASAFLAGGSLFAIGGALAQSGVNAEACSSIVWQAASSSAPELRLAVTGGQWPARGRFRRCPGGATLALVGL
jgi:hypothetical protein